MKRVPLGYSEPMRPRYEVRRFEALPGLILVSAHHDGHASVPHAHAEVSLGFCPDGLDEFRCGSFHGPVAAGSFLAVEGGQIHSDRTKAGPILMVYAPESLVGGPLVFDRPVVHDPGLEGAFHALFRPGPPAWDEFQALWLSRPWVKPGRRPASRFAPLLERLTNEVPSLGTLAAEAGLGPSTFLRQFRKEVGCTPHEYSRQARLAQAARGLLQGSAQADAAVDHEFFDQSHFHRHFRKIYSVSPGEFRRRNSVQS